jgi:predicted small lipoprotein YifL
MPLVPSALRRLTLILLLAGCGQSGPLYLPGNPSEIQTPPAVPADSASEEEEDDGDDNGEGG